LATGASLTGVTVMLIVANSAIRLPVIHTEGEGVRAIEVRVRRVRDRAGVGIEASQCSIRGPVTIANVSVSFSTSPPVSVIGSRYLRLWSHSGYSQLARRSPALQ